MELIEVENGFFRIRDVQSIVVQPPVTPDTNWSVHVSFTRGGTFKTLFTDEPSAQKAYAKFKVAIKKYREAQDLK